jgi:hypothetical protein
MKEHKATVATVLAVVALCRYLPRWSLKSARTRKPQRYHGGLTLRIHNGDITGFDDPLFARLRKGGPLYGAVVAVDPNTGRVLTVEPEACVWRRLYPFDDQANDRFGGAEENVINRDTMLKVTPQLRTPPSVAPQ